MVPGAGIMAGPDAVLLFAVCRAHARIHIEHGTSRRTTTMDGIDPMAGKIGERRKVLFRREPTRLEAAHLARRCRCPQSRLAANNPTHRGIMTQAFCVIHILVSGKSPEHRLSQHSDESMPAVLAGAGVGSFPWRAHKPASEVTTDPRNWSISRRSKSSLRTSAFDSPAGFAMTTSFDPAKHANYVS